MDPVCICQLSVFQMDHGISYHTDSLIIPCKSFLCFYQFLLTGCQKIDLMMVLL